MEEIKVYHSLRKKAMLLIVCVVFVVAAIFLLNQGGNQFIAWICILFFGIGGLFIASLVIKEKITGKPYLLITDKSVVMNSLKDWEIAFSDVEYFKLIGEMNSMMIGIKYKDNIERKKTEEAEKIISLIREMNIELAGCQEAIPASGLTMKPELLCELLNKRLKH